MKRMIWMALGDVGKLERILQIGLSIVHSVNLCSDHFSSRLPFTSHPPASFIREAGGILLGFWHFSGPYVENRVRGSLKPTLSLLCTLRNHLLPIGGNTGLVSSYGNRFVPFTPHFRMGPLGTESFPLIKGFFVKFL